VYGKHDNLTDPWQFGLLTEERTRLREIIWPHCTKPSVTMEHLFTSS